MTAATLPARLARRLAAILKSSPGTLAVASRFYVYAYVDVCINQPFYIGKGMGSRCRSHLNRSHNLAMRARIAQLGRDGIEVRILADELTEEQAVAFERATIAHHGRLERGEGPLLNRTAGGEGRANTRVIDPAEISSAVDDAIAAVREADKWDPREVQRRLFAIWNAS